METRKEGSDLKIRTKRFAHRCVKLATHPPKLELRRIVERQLLRCATSSAANYRAAQLAQSKASFAAKLRIVLKEVDECWFWLEFIRKEGLIPEEQIRDLLNEAEELTRIFAVARKTSQKNK